MTPTEMRAAARLNVREKRLVATLPVVLGLVSGDQLTDIATAGLLEGYESPALAMREKKDASILVGCDLVRNGKADAIVTAGHTGAAMAAAPGCSRQPAAMITRCSPRFLLTSIP